MGSTSSDSISCNNSINVYDEIGGGMPRLNNKDYTVEELEKLIFIVNGLVQGTMYNYEVPEAHEEIKKLIAGSQFTNFEDDIKPVPIPWNFKFEMLITPETKENAEVIVNGMRSSEVNENIKRRFNAIVREEVNWYIDRVKYFMVKGDTNILE